MLTNFTLSSSIYELTYNGNGFGNGFRHRTIYFDEMIGKHIYDVKVKGKRTLEPNFNPEFKFDNDSYLPF